MTSLAYMLIDRARPSAHVCKLLCQLDPNILHIPRLPHVQAAHLSI